MAKAATAKKPAKEEESHQFEVAHLAKELGILETSARVALRAKGVEKAGKKYGWNSKKAFDEVVALLSTKSNDDDKKPAKKAKKK